MNNHDQRAAQRFEGVAGSEGSVLGQLNKEITALKGPASREIIKMVNDRSRNLATLHRTSEARKLLGLAVDPVFYDKRITKSGVVVTRNQKRPPKFIKATLPSQFPLV